MGVSLICLAGLAGATETVSLDRDESRRMALEYSRQVKMSENRLDQALLREKIARAAQLPGLKASGLYFYSPDEIGFMLDPLFLIGMESGLPDLIGEILPDIDLGIGLEGVTMGGVEIDQVVYAGGRVRIARRMAQTGTSLASLDIDLQTTEVIAIADAAFFRYVAVLEMEKAAEKYLELLGELVETIEDSKAEGMATRNELLKVKVKRNEARLKVQKAGSGRELARMDLCRVLGLPLHTPLEVTWDVEVTEEEIMPAEKYDQRISKRPEYQMLEKAVEISEQQVQMSRAEMLPEIGFRAGYSYLGGIEVGGQTSDNTSLSAMALVRIPIFNWSESRNKLAIARLKEEEARLEKKDAARLLQLEMARERLQLEDALTRLELTASALEYADENMETSQDKFHEGVETLTDLLEAQAQWQAALSDHIEAQTTVSIRKTMYLKAIGELTNH